MENRNSLTKIKPLEFRDETPKRKLNVQWDLEGDPQANAIELARALRGTGLVYRLSRQHDCLVYCHPGSDYRLIAKKSEFSAMLMDLNAQVAVHKSGVYRSDNLPTQVFETIRNSSVFMESFPEIDRITKIPSFLPGWELTAPGYGNGGDGHRVMFTGETPRVSKGTEVIDEFLNLMDFDNESSRTNALGAALGVALRHCFSGNSPLILLTANMSGAGKDTVAKFIASSSRSTEISFTSKNWAMEQAIFNAVNHDEDVGVINVGNVRPDAQHKLIESSVIERLITSPEISLMNSRIGRSMKVPNHLVFTLTTNEARFITDLANRSVVINLNSTGDLRSRKSPVGDIGSFLDRNREEIASELRGMIIRWKELACPEDESVHHRFSTWARVIGGILRVNERDGFLDNTRQWQNQADPKMEDCRRLAQELEVNKFYRIKDLLVTVTRNNLFDWKFADARANAANKLSELGKLLTSMQGMTFEIATDGGEKEVILQKSKRRDETGIEAFHYGFVAQITEGMSEQGQENTCTQAEPVFDLV